MKFHYPIIALLLASSFAFGDIEYYFGDSTSFNQSQADQKQLPPGAFAIAKGTTITGYIGVFPKKTSMRISDSVSTMPDSGKLIELKGQLNESFKNGDLITLPSGCKVQYFKSIGNQSDRLVTYNSDQLLIGITDLIKKKETDQCAAVIH